MTSAGEAAQRLREKIAPERQIVICAIGGDWGDGSAGTAGFAAAALRAHALPSGVVLHELGTGALDISYDVMRGYDFCMLLDVTVGAGDGDGDGAIYEADEKEVDASIEDGQEVSPHAKDVGTVLHFIKHVGGWPGAIYVVPCDPSGGEAGAAAAVERLFTKVAELQDA
ncbi:MAG: hypothetical protein LC720_00455 [Actinobacteria bacterium]|nr:hypothetical protein [Actinomycetota bacterium]